MNPYLRLDTRELSLEPRLAELYFYVIHVLQGGRWKEVEPESHTKPEFEIKKVAEESLGVNPHYRKCASALFEVFIEGQSFGDLQAEKCLSIGERGVFRYLDTESTNQLNRWVETVAARLSGDRTYSGEIIPELRNVMNRWIPGPLTFSEDFQIDQAKSVLVDLLLKHGESFVIPPAMKGGRYAARIRFALWPFDAPFIPEDEQAALDKETGFRLQPLFAVSLDLNEGALDIEERYAIHDEILEYTTLPYDIEGHDRPLLWTPKMALDEAYRLVEMNTDNIYAKRDFDELTRTVKAKVKHFLQVPAKARFAYVYGLPLTHESEIPRQNFI